MKAMAMAEEIEDNEDKEAEDVKVVAERGVEPVLSAPKSDVISLEPRSPTCLKSKNYEYIHLAESGLRSPNSSESGPRSPDPQ